MAKVSYRPTGMYVNVFDGCMVAVILMIMHKQPRRAALGLYIETSIEIRQFIVDDNYTTISRSE